MKSKIIMFCVILLSAPLYSQDCSELFISEYIEGSSQNKAIEIYNPTSSAIDLSAYSIERYSNGSSTISESLTLSGSIDPNGVWVVTNGETDSTDQFGYCFPELYNLGNQAGSEYPSPMHFNGNDAITLSKNGTIVDLIGKIGEDPGEGGGWTDDVTAGFTDANGGDWWTKNKTLVRKKEVLAGITANPILFDPTVEWDSLSQNTFSELGTHTCDCNPSSSISERSNKLSFVVFPNPIEINGAFNISTSSAIENITLTNFLGQTMFVDYTLNNNTATVSTKELAKGLYVITVLDDRMLSNSSTVFVK